MTITLSWYMLVPLLWIAGIFGLLGLSTGWFFDISDFRTFAILGILPAILMLLTRFLP